MSKPNCNECLLQFSTTGDDVVASLAVELGEAKDEIKRLRSALNGLAKDAEAYAVCSGDVQCPECMVFSRLAKQAKQAMGE